MTLYRSRRFFSPSSSLSWSSFLLCYLISSIFESLLLKFILRLWWSVWIYVYRLKMDTSLVLERHNCCHPRGSNPAFPHHPAQISGKVRYIWFYMWNKIYQSYDARIVTLFSLFVSHCIPLCIIAMYLCRLSHHPPSPTMHRNDSEESLYFSHHDFCLKTHRQTLSSISTLAFYHLR